MSISRRFRWLAAALAGMGAVAAAQTIDFESLPGGGSPAPLMPLNTQYQASHGVTFSTLNGALVGFGEYGGPTQEGWIGPGGPDSLAPGYSGGGYFFNYESQGFNTLVVTLFPPCSAVSIEIIDIDDAGGSEFESWTMTAIGASGPITAATVDVSDPGTGDGVMTPLTVTAGTNVITSVQIVYSGAPGTNYGVGFDNLGLTRNPVGCAGDCNGDGMRDQADLALLLAFYGTSGGPCDPTGDGVVDQADLAFLLANYNQPC